MHSVEWTLHAAMKNLSFEFEKAEQRPLTSTGRSIDAVRSVEDNLPPARPPACLPATKPTSQSVSQLLGRSVGWLVGRSVDAAD